MIVIFFGTNISFVKNKIKDNKNKYCAFWYAQGLNSYQSIENIIDITSVFVEESIYDSFKNEYAYIFDKFPTEVFPSSINPKNSDVSNICVFASNDTHIFLFQNIIKQLTNPYKIFCRKNEHAAQAASKVGLVVETIDKKIPEAGNYKALLVGNDWGPLEQNINLDFLQHGSNTICLQESVIDFNVKDKRMLQCSFPVFQGIVTLKHVDLKNKICAVIGNPRYEKLTSQPLPAENKVLVNVNFTYGIFESERDNWVNQVVNTCGKLNTDYAIIQHPRDRGNFEKFNLIKTNASNVHGELMKSSILVTRFSSLIHEGLCLGRVVIYHNPHGEKLFYDFEPDNKCLFYTRSEDELFDALRSIINSGADVDTATEINKYLQRHIGVTRKGIASDYIKKVIEDVSTFPLIRDVTLWMVLYNFAKRVKRTVFRQGF